MTDQNNISLDPKLRDDWNGFAQHLDSMGADVSNMETTQKYLQGYKKDNPDSKLTDDHIPVAINEVNQLKQGNPIGTLTPDQSKYIQSGMTHAYKNNANNLKYPVSEDHGTDLEGHVKANEKNIPVSVVPPGDASPKPGVTPNPGTVPPTSTPSNVIPRPQSFDDPKATQEYRNALYKKYGPYVKDNADLPENLDYTIQGEKDSLKDITNNAATKLGIKPAVLYSSAMQEGMRGLIPTAKNKGKTDYSGDDKFPISGFTSFGMDHVYDMIPELQKKGYLPKGFEQNLKKSVETIPQNEVGAGKKVNSANFKNIDSAMQAKAAVLKESYDDLDNIVKEEKIPLSDKGRDFFALVAYNGGEGLARSMMKSYFKKGYLKNDKFLDKQPDSSWSGPYKNVIQRIKGADLLKGEGYF